MEDKGQNWLHSIQKGPITCSALRIRDPHTFWQEYAQLHSFKTLAQRKDVFNEIVSCATSTNTQGPSISTIFSLERETSNQRLEGLRILVVTTVQREKEA